MKKTMVIIVEYLAKAGWQKDRIVNAFSKQIPTFLGSVQASFWVRFDEKQNHWMFSSGSFTSAGENVLASTYAQLAGQASDSEVRDGISELLAEVDKQIQTAWSVKLLNTP